MAVRTAARRTPGDCIVANEQFKKTAWVQMIVALICKCHANDKAMMQKSMHTCHEEDFQGPSERVLVCLSP